LGCASTGSAFGHSGVVADLAKAIASYSIDPDGVGGELMASFAVSLWSSIGYLLRLGSPADIAWLVIPVHVDAIDRMLR
jgi:hypothetical protein